MVPIGFDVKFMEAIEGFCWERERERERERRLWWMVEAVPHISSVLF
jgi:hypothetical protein